MQILKGSIAFFDKLFRTIQKKQRGSESQLRILCRRNSMTANILFVRGSKS